MGLIRFAANRVPLFEKIRKMDPMDAADMIDGGASSKHGAKAPVASMPEQALSYVNRPEGEVDMLVGFFLMNGVCIVFFLLFGMCVIFSCLRRRPKMFQAEPKEIVAVAAPPSPKPARTFKSLVNKAMKTADLTALNGNDMESAKKETAVMSDGEQVQIHVINEKSSRGSDRSTRRGSVKPQLAIEEEVGEINEPKSVIRENLLGPLSFDDLYYT